MGGMAILEFYSIFLLPEQVSLKLFVSLGYFDILKRELIIGREHACLVTMLSIC
jgi:hypothetical protein